MRRDIYFVISSIFTKKTSESKDVGFVIDHPEIEAYIAEQYSKDVEKK